MNSSITKYVRRIFSVSMTTIMVSTTVSVAAFAADFPPATVGEPYDGSATIGCDGSYGWTDSNGQANAPEDFGLSQNNSNNSDGTWTFRLTGTPTASQTLTVTTSTDAASLTISESAASETIDSSSGSCSNDDYQNTEWFQEYARKLNADNNKASGDESKSSTGTSPQPPVSNPAPTVGLVNTTQPAGSTLTGNISIQRQEQGELAKMAFNSARPAGWRGAYTFNMLINNSTDSSLKKGTISLKIPAEFVNAGGDYAIMAIDKDGKVVIFYDTDNDPSTITVDIDCEGYAFELIYKN